MILYRRWRAAACALLALVPLDVNGVSPTPPPTSTALPSVTPSLPPTPLPTAKPTITPLPTPLPTFNPTALPTAKPTPAPVPAPTRDPTHLPTFAPTFSPSVAPTIEAIPSPMPTLPKAVYRPDFFHRNLRGVNPLALGIAFLSIIGLVFAFSKGREMYDEWEVRTRKRDFGDVELSNVESRNSAREETKDASSWRASSSDGTPMLGSSSSSSGAARTPPNHSLSKLYPSRTISRLWRDAGIGPRDELGYMQEGGSGWAVSKSEMAHWPDGRVFLEKAGLGEFWAAFEAQAITSVDDLCDVSLIGDVELVREIGMNKVQITLFRRAVSDRANAGSSRPMVQQLAASAHSGGGGSGVGDGSSGVDSGTGRDLRSNLLGKPLGGAVHKALAAQERQRRAAAAQARELQGMERQKALDVLESRQAARQEQAKMAAKAQAKSSRRPGSSSSSAGGDGQLEGLLGNLGFENGGDPAANSKDSGKKDVYQGSNSAPGTRGVAV